MKSSAIADPLPCGCNGARFSIVLARVYLARRAQTAKRLADATAKKKKKEKESVFMRDLSLNFCSTFS